MNHRICVIMSWIFAAVLLAGGCSKPVQEVRVIDTANDELVIVRGERAGLHEFYTADFVVLGGGMGGIAAALSICSAGRSVLLVEESDQVAGCFAGQDTAMFAESKYVETSGTSATYQEFRRRIREWYDSRAAEQPQIYTELYSTIGDFQPGAFCFESEAALDVIEDMLAHNIERGKLTVLKRHKVARIVNFNNRIASLEAVDLDNMVVNQITGWMYVDATRTGYIYPIAGLQHRTGPETAAMTGEAHAPATADSMGAYRTYYVPEYPVPMGNDDYEDVVRVPLARTRSGENTVPVQVPVDPLRIEALYMISEQAISAAEQAPPRAEFYKDSVGIGYSPIVLNGEDHPTEVVPTLPFQIPFRSLVPVNFTNVIAGGWTMGTTAVAGHAYRSPLVEWAVGEAAGEAAAYCAGFKVYTDMLSADEKHVRSLQEWLVEKRGTPIYWYDDVAPQDEDFGMAQMRPFIDPDYHEELEARGTLNYHGE